MKKCASCTKDLPDAALHCVFCGAKQAPAPATAGGMAKTVMGAYSASDMMEHLKQQGAQPPAAAPYRPQQQAPAYQPPQQQTPAYQPPQQRSHSPSAQHQPPYEPPRAHSPSAQHQPQPYPPGAASAANAKTMFVPGSGPGSGPGPAPQGAFRGGPQQAHPVGNSPGHASSVPLSAPMPQPAPIMPVSAIPSASPPYLASQTAARAGRPLEPWKDALRVLMFVWGGLLLAAFATPLSIDPLIFNWNIIADAEGTAKLPPLIMAAVGLLALVIAGIPMSPVPRGIMAALLGLAGILVPVLLGGVPPWQLLVPMVGMIVLIPNLLVRNEYRDAALPRILITVGVIAALVPYVIPQRGSMPLVELFKLAIEAPGAFKVIVLLQIALIVVLVLSLLAWLPSPSSAGAKVFAWLLILWPVITHVVVLVLSGNLVDGFKASPYAAGMSWVAGAGGMPGGDGGISMSIGIGVAYAVLVGYGLATVIAKKLE
ncbi:MAG: hypothetical protein H0T89_23390 [Deltaproteobacteria bacterium]|nr:hypothetical protein [Deltaproteobacteria bacterium]MDQ3299306.1 hypothetical protein [Myxococcota bacterium]